MKKILIKVEIDCLSKKKYLNNDYGPSEPFGEYLTHKKNIEWKKYLF